MYDLVFMFASPLTMPIIEEKTGKIINKTIKEIDYQREFNGVIHSLKKT